MHNPGFLEHWRSTLSRGDVLAHAASDKSDAVTRAAVALGLSFAPVFAVASVCAAFLLIEKLF
jgi:hypothetical protein